MNKKTIKDFVILAAVIIIAAIGARFLAHGETLSEYAAKTGQSGETAKEASSVDTSEEKEAETKIEPDKSESDEGKESDKENASDGADVTDEEGKDEETKDSKTDTNITLNKNISPERVTYMEGFYYEPVSDEVFDRIDGISYPTDCDLDINELRYVKVLYIDFDGESKEGELICNKAIAQDLTEIFYELYQNNYAIESIKLVDEFGGDDTASMLANNTSCFNYRVVEGTTRLSNHAYGLAIDLNPFYNPYITYNKDMTVNVSPKGSEPYADRDADFPYKIDENDLAYRLFTEHGFKWGGNWNNSKDYQHFEKK